MNAGINTIFLRLEGPLQAWGDNSKFVIRRTMDAPTKSGVVGLICCAMGLRRRAVSADPIEDDELRRLADLWPKDHRPPTVLHLLNTLAMGVRKDRPGTRWWDYHTVGAKVGVLKADGTGIKRTGGGKDDPIETLISRREYLCDASFLVALRGQHHLIRRVTDALANPKWTLYLGRKSCPPTLPILAGIGSHTNLSEALESQRWCARYENDNRPEDDRVPALIEWRLSPQEPTAPADAEVWYDAPVSFDPPVHEPRLVVRTSIDVQVGEAIQRPTPAPPRPRADYGNTEYKKRRAERLQHDHGLCVFCKCPASTVQHVTYRRAGGHEEPDDLRSLCRLCHDAVTMIEYGLGMGMDRINPEEPRWREMIIRKRQEIIDFRSLATRRRRLTPEEVE